MRGRGPRVRITPQGKHRHRREFSVDLGDGRPQILDPASGWQEVARPLKRSMSQYAGTPLFRVSVPVLFNGLSENTSVQREVDRVVELWRPEDDDDEPPVIRVHGPLPFAGRLVVVETIEFGKAISDETDKARLIYQALTLTLMEYVSPDQIKFKRVKASSGGGHHKTYTTKEGDTLNKISVKKYGDRSKAKEIGRLNDIRDVTKKLRAGRELRLP